MKIGIIGGGITGLVAAYKLLKKGEKVDLFEKENSIGGLASTFSIEHGSWPLECFYHHFFTDDTRLFALLKELEISDSLIFKTPVTGIMYKDKVYPFDNPGALLKFPHLGFFDKVKLGQGLLRLRKSKNWQKYDGLTAVETIPKLLGQKSYEILWEPLLKGKFSYSYKDINMAWFWSRIYKRSQSLGYFDGSLNKLTKTLSDNINFFNGNIYTNNEVKYINPIADGKVELMFNDDSCKIYDKVIVTLPCDKFSNLNLNIKDDYRAYLQQFKTLGCISLVLSIKEPLFKNIYWLNINDANFPFLVLVMHTNFIPPTKYKGLNLLYIGKYLFPDEAQFSMEAESLIDLYMPYLQKLNASFSREKIKDYWLFKSDFAQPLPDVGYSKKIPPIKTPIKNVYLSNMQQIYPWDRGVNFSVELAEKAVELLYED